MIVILFCFCFYFRAFDSFDWPLRRVVVMGLVEQMDVVKFTCWHIGLQRFKTSGQVFIH